MPDITLALIFSQLPHPECWMPRLPLEALNCFWLALPAWFLVLVWLSCLCGGGVCLLVLLLFMCNLPLIAEVPVPCEVCVILWWYYCLYGITTVLNVQYFSPPLSWLKPYWYSAHRLLLNQMQCVVGVGGGRFTFFHSLFFFFYFLVLNFYCHAVSPIVLLSSRTLMGFSRSVQWGRF